MAKEVIIDIDNNSSHRLSLVDDFGDYLKRCSNTNVYCGSLYGDYMSDDFDDDGYLEYLRRLGYGDFVDDYLEGIDEYEDNSCLYRKNSKKEGKRGKDRKKGKKKAKGSYCSIYADEFEEECIDNKEIRYYRDYNNPDDYELFKDLYTFDEFCDSEGIEVSEEEVRNLMLREYSYCCINPRERRDNHKNILLTDSSYGGLRWSCAESEDELLYRL